MIGNVVWTEPPVGLSSHLVEPSPGPEEGC
mgnify:CR=1 FL=1